jgi:hypothetical protein
MHLYINPASVEGNFSGGNFSIKWYNCVISDLGTTKHSCKFQNSRDFEMVEVVVKVASISYLSLFQQCSWYF